MLLFVICNYMREILNMCKVYVNYKSLFIERQCYIFTSLAQGTCTVAASSREDHSNNNDVNKHGCRRECQCQESCTNNSLTFCFWC